MRTFEFRDPGRLRLIDTLKRVSKEQGAAVWMAVAEELGKPKRLRREVNLWKINEHTRENDVVVVPGKVLGDGELDHKVQIAAYKFSKRAEEKIKCAGGKVMSIQKLLKLNPRGTGVKLLG